MIGENLKDIDILASKIKKIKHNIEKYDASHDFESITIELFINQAMRNNLANDIPIEIIIKICETKKQIEILIGNNRVEYSITKLTELISCHPFLISNHETLVSTVKSRWETLCQSRISLPAEEYNLEERKIKFCIIDYISKM